MVLGIDVQILIMLANLELKTIVILKCIAFADNEYTVGKYRNKRTIY